MSRVTAVTPRLPTRLWDVHTHLGDLIPDPCNLLETESIGDYTIRAGRNAMDALRASITGIRVVAESSFVDVAWKGADPIKLNFARLL